VAVMKKKKVVLVTGGARGIGRAIACAFAAEQFCVCLNYRTSKRDARKTTDMIVARGGEIYTFQADVSQPAGVKRLIRDVVKRTGRIDGVINNAGWSEYVPFSQLSQLSERVVTKIIDSNLKSVFYVSREVLPLFISRKRGQIINIASLSGIDAQGSNVVYSAAKAAVLSLTQSFARDSVRGIRVNAIAPSYVDTSFIKTIPTKIINKACAMNPSKKLLSAHEVACVTLRVYKNNDVNGSVFIMDKGRVRKKTL